MARARTIKPGFFKNERLAIKGVDDNGRPIPRTPLIRILFEGLWTLADREGRLEDRPMQIKADVLPYDDCDIYALLEELASICEDDGLPSFIFRYTVNGKRYIQVLNFKAHNHCHVREPVSTIPAPTLPDKSTVLAPCQSGEKTSLYPSPTTHYPLPTTHHSKGASTVQESAAGDEEIAATVEPEVVEAEVVVPDQPTPPDAQVREAVPYQYIVDEYNRLCVKMPRAEVLSEDRRRSIRARVKECESLGGIEAIVRVFQYASQSPHHNGANDLGWRADFDWLMGPRNFRKMLERARSGTLPGSRASPQAHTDDGIDRFLARVKGGVGP